MDRQTHHSDTGPMKEAEILRLELRVLTRQHRELDAQIQEEERAPAPDAIHIRRLKQRKLALKDLIARLEDRLLPDIIA